MTRGGPHLVRTVIPFLFVLLGVLFFSPESPECSTSETLYESRLDKGLTTTEEHSYFLMNSAREDTAKARDLLSTAKKYSPDLPAVYFAFAGETLSPSADGLFLGLDYFRQGINAYGKNFWWKFSMAGLVYISLLVSFVVSALVTVLIRLPLDAGLLHHDGLEQRNRLLLLGVPALLSFFGPVGFTAGAVLVLGLYFRKEHTAVVYAVLLFFLFSPMLRYVVDVLLSKPPALKAVVNVNEGRENRYALTVLKDMKDFTSSYSYALALKREGDFGQAIETLKQLAPPTHESTSRLYVNLGNAYYGLKDIEAAKNAYLRSVQTAPLPSAYYNLSQIHREMLDFPKGDEYFLEAAKLSPEAVTRFTSIAGTNPNRFVIDETLPASSFWRYVMQGRRLSLSYGAGLTLLAALASIISFYLINKRLRYRAHRCKRCGTIYCSKCTHTVTWGEMCQHCYRSFVKIDELDARERVARLLSIYDAQVKRRERARMLSYAIPGAGQIYSGSILPGFMLLWLFFFSLAVLSLRGLPALAPYPFTHGWLTSFMIAFIVLTYASSIVLIRRRRQKGWL